MIMVNINEILLVTGNSARCSRIFPCFNDVTLITHIMPTAVAQGRYERPDSVDLSATSIAVAQATEHVQTDEDFDATAQGYFDLLFTLLEPWAELQSILDPSESEHDDDCDCNECPF